MALERLKIFPEQDPKHPLETEEDGSITVRFNPTTYSISKSVSWEPSTSARSGSSNDSRANAPTRSFGGGGSRQLSLELFFDSTELPEVERDVRLQTDRIVQLTRIKRDLENPRPPICSLLWGIGRSDFPFRGTVSQLDQQFLLFHESGDPLRATLKVVFLEFLSLEDDQRETDPELTTRIVRRGDTLASIAAEAYRNPAAWRTIALANRIENPLVLVPGTKLTLPKDAT
jgi:Contractile injection system tube protein/LysM domain